MPLNLSDTLVVGVSSTALFDLAEAEQVFHRGIKEYRRYMLEREGTPLEPGTALPLVRALLNLNKHGRPEDPLVEVVVMSKNSPETGVRVLQTIRELGLPISRSAFSGGESLADYMSAFDVDLFLSTSAEDVQRVIDSEACAAAVVLPPPARGAPLPEDQVRIAFDADAVLFDESSEILYQTKGLREFHRVEDAEKDVPLAAGPYATLLKKLARLQERLPTGVEYSPVRIAIVTARNAPAEMRVIKTLRQWGIYVDEAFFLGGLEKHKVLAAFRPHIFFDDQDAHLREASAVVPAGKVPYRTSSPFRAAGEDAPVGAPPGPRNGAPSTDKDDRAH
jgi:5'-nucleotidase